jgi:cytochrome c biogenesis protein ResB
MNHPLKQNAFTIYQSSYETDESGTPRYSILSVNQDPGRWIKYSGALMIVLGIISMFYFKPKYTGDHKMLKKEARV